MDTVYAIIFEMLVLAFFAFIFYTIQKRKIIKKANQEVKDLIEEITSDIKSQSSLEEDYEVKNYLIELKTILDMHNVLDCKVLPKAPKKLPAEVIKKTQALDKLL